MHVDLNMSRLADWEALMSAKIDTNITLTLTRYGTNMLNWRHSQLSVPQANENYQKRQNEKKR